jgi:hypothetical protein
MLAALAVMTATIASAAPLQLQTGGIRPAATLSCPSRCANSAFSSLYQEEGGKCALKANLSCFPSICDGGTGLCRAASCSFDAQCAVGAGCNTVTGTCAPITYRCKDPTTVISSTGLETSCAPHHCNAGACTVN